MESIGPILLVVLSRAEFQRFQAPPFWLLVAPCIPSLLLVARQMAGRRLISNDASKRRRSLAPMCRFSPLPLPRGWKFDSDDRGEAVESPPEKGVETPQPIVTLDKLAGESLSAAADRYTSTTLETHRSGYTLMERQSCTFGGLVGELRIAALQIEATKYVTHYFYVDAGRFIQLLVSRQGGPALEECEAAAQAFFSKAAKRVQSHMAYLSGEANTRVASIT